MCEWKLKFSDKFEKNRFIFVICVLIIIVVLYINLEAIEKTPKTNIHPKPRIEIPSSEKIINKMKQWTELLSAVHLGNWSVSSKTESLDNLYLHDCWRDDNWLRMYADPYCTFLWSRIMEHEQIESLDFILAVITNDERDQGVEAKHNQNGGMRSHFGSFPKKLEMKGYWKPCTSLHLPQNSETFESEIIAFYVDRILGFYRTPVVVPRYFSKSEFQFYANEAMEREDNRDVEAGYKLQTVLDRCGTDDHLGAQGAMVGWTNTIAETLDKKHNKLKKEMLVNMFKIHSTKVENYRSYEFNVTNESDDDQIEWVIENLSVNLFTILMGNTQKFSHSVFVMKKIVDKSNVYGPMLYIDNDRSSWKKDVFRSKISRDHPITKICKFPQELALNILLLNQHEDLSLGKLVKQVADVYAASTGHYFFTDLEAYWLDDRVKFIANAIEECIHQYGVDNVLIREYYKTEFDPIEMWSKLLNN